MDGKPRVLVAYASAGGSTAGVATCIAEALRRSGSQVVCVPAGPDVDIDGFDAFVVGSAVHNMAWLPPALEVMRRVADRDRPLWCFSVGGIQPRGAATRRLTDLELQRVAQAFPASARPRAHRMFGGIIAMDGTPLWGRLFYRLTGGRPGDHRDWPAIAAYGEEIGRELAVPGDGAASSAREATRSAADDTASRA